MQSLYGITCTKKIARALRAPLPSSIIHVGPPLAEFLDPPLLTGRISIPIQVIQQKINNKPPYSTSCMHASKRKNSNTGTRLNLSSRAMPMLGYSNWCIFLFNTKNNTTAHLANDTVTHIDASVFKLSHHRLITLLYISMLALTHVVLAHISTAPNISTKKDSFHVNR